MHLIVKTVFGSHLYGTATAKSDRDFKGVFVPTVRDTLLGRIPKTASLFPKDASRKNEAEELDGDLYSLHHFLRLATQGQTVAIDMLFTPPSLVERGPHAWIWDRIIDNRQRLLSKSMNAFIGYARGQAAKYSLKGSRLEKLIKFQGALEGTCPEIGIGTYWDRLPRDDERTNPAGIRELQIAGKWFGETTAVKFVVDVVERSIKRYGARAYDAYESEGTDWKALSHAVRVTKELKELLAFGQVTFPLPDAAEIRAIKMGDKDIRYVQDLLDQDLIEVEILAAQSSLPEAVDITWWDDFLLDVMNEHLARYES